MRNVSKIAPLNLPKFESPSPILTHFSSTKTLKKSTKKSSTKVTKPVKLFEDSDFPPTQSSIGKTLSKNVAIEWLRPHEISQNPVFSSTNNTTGHLFEHLDVQQGDLGDCWFLAALGSLTAQPLFFGRVVPLDQVCSGVDYDGKFEFNFFQYGEWAKVFVDDRLPTVNGNLIYTRSNDRNEFWVALLEKAYAKIHRCYENLLGGTAGEAMVDLTGGLLEYIEFKKDNIPISEVVSTIFDAVKKGSLIGCAIQSRGESHRDDGLVAGHAYSITAVDVNNKNQEIVRLMNPWGDTEFSQQIVKNGDLEDDGEFWISMDDFYSNFTKVEICHFNSDTWENPEGHWHEEREDMGWKQGITAGGRKEYASSYHKNPGFSFELDGGQKGDGCIVSISQKFGRATREGFDRHHKIGFDIYQLTNWSDVEAGNERAFYRNNQPIFSFGHVIRRDVVKKLSLQGGIFTVVCSTYSPNAEGEFLLRIFTEKNLLCSKKMLRNKECKIECARKIDDVNVGGSTPQPVFKLSIIGYRSKIRQDFLNYADDGDCLDLEGFTSVLRKFMSYLQYMNEKIPTSKVPFSKANIKSLFACSDFCDVGRLSLDEWNYFIKNFLHALESFIENSADDQYLHLDSFDVSRILETKYGWTFSDRIINVLLMKYGEHTNGGAVSLKNYFVMMFKLLKFVEIYKNGKASNQNIDLEDWLCCVMHC